jgi:lysophospholipase L1-like esterase
MPGRKTGARATGRRKVVRIAIAAASLAVLGTAMASVRSAGPSPAVFLPRVERTVEDGRTLRIVAFGSSSTWGTGASSRSRTYPADLEADLDRVLARDRADVENAGVGGEDADDMMRRIPRVVAERPDLVIWQTGTNDPLRQVPVARFVAETEAGVRAFKAAGIDVMLMEPQYCPRLLGARGWEAYLEAVRLVGRETATPVVRRYDLMKRWMGEGLTTRSRLLSPDGLHMADDGYALLAEDVADEILADADLR